jgi:hypothetical protein
MIWLVVIYWVQFSTAHISISRVRNKIQNLIQKCKLVGKTYGSKFPSTFHRYAITSLQQKHRFDPSHGPYFHCFNLKFLVEAMNVWSQWGVEARFRLKWRPQIKNPTNLNINLNFRRKFSGNLGLKCLIVI